MVEGTFARVFKSELQPVEVASAIQHEMDERAAIVAQGRTLVPNDFVVEIAHTDAERLDILVESLSLELATLPPPPDGVSQTRLPPRAIIRRVYTRVQMAAGQLPATEEGKLILNSYSPNGEWYVMVTPGMYELSITKGTNHFSPYSYDRHVPLAFYGSVFIPGTYHDRVAPVDIAATFASLLRVNQPSACVGHVLTVAIRPEAAAAEGTSARKTAQ